MAARARVRFGSTGSRGVINRFQAVGRAASGAHRKTGRLNLGLGRAAHEAGRGAARFALFARGLKNVREAISGAERPWHRFGRGVEGVLSALSRKFAQYRRSVWFYQRAVVFYGRQIKRVGGIFRKTGDDVSGGMGRMGRGGGGGRGGRPPRGPTAAGLEGPSRALIEMERTGARASTMLARLSKVLRVVGAVATMVVAPIAAVGVALGGLYAVAGYFGAKFAARIVKGFMGIRETFRMYEISLGGIIRNTQATAKIMKFAADYAAEYPAMFEDVVDAFRGLASMPTLKPLFRKADYEDLKGIMDVVQGLATLKPQQGVAGAMMALREALSGQMRSLRMRFEVNVREMAEEAGFSFTEITHDANKALIAMRKFVELNVPAEAMGSMAKTVSVQYGNLYDRYRMFVSEMMRSTGAYWAVVTALMRLNEWLKEVFKAPMVVAFAQKVGNALRELVSAFEKVMGLIDWEKYLKTGDVAGAIEAVCAKIREFFAALWAEVGEDTKEALRKIVRAVGGLLLSAIKAIFSGIWEMIKMGFADAGTAAGSWFVRSLATQLRISKGYLDAFLYGLSGGRWGKMPERPTKGAWPKVGVEEEPHKIDWEKRFEEDFDKAIVGFEAAVKKAEVGKIISQAFEGMGALKPEPVDVGEDITEIENKRLKVIRMALRMFGEWTGKYKEQKKDAEGLLAVTSKLADVMALPAMVKEQRDLSAEVDRVGEALRRGNFYEGERLQLLQKDEKLQQQVAALSEKIAVARAHKAEDLSKLLQQGVKARDAILKKEGEIVEKIKKARTEMARLNTAMITGIASTTVSFFNDWRGMFNLVKKFGNVMGKTMIPAGMFGQGRRKVTWGRGVERPSGGEWKGVPIVFRELIKRLKGALAGEETAAGRYSYIKGIMGLFKEAMPYARGREAKAGIAEKAMVMFPDLLTAQAEQAREAVKLQQSQLTELTQMRKNDEILIKGSDDQLVELKKIAGKEPLKVVEKTVGGLSSIGNRKITEANLEVAASFL